MTKIYNSNLTKAIIEGAKLQTSTDKIPDELAEKVVPVMEVNPNLLRNINFVKRVNIVNTATTTVYTTPTDKDFYLTNAFLNFIKDALNTSVSTQLIITTEDSITDAIISFAQLTLTAQVGNENVQFNPAIKLKRGSNITASAASVAAGNISMNVGFAGYFVNNINA